MKHTWLANMINSLETELSYLAPLQFSISRPKLTPQRTPPSFFVVVYVVYVTASHL